MIDKNLPSGLPVRHNYDGTDLPVMDTPLTDGSDMSVFQNDHRAP